MPLSPLYEIYEIRNGQWSLVERFSSISDTSARDRAAAHFDLTKTPCVLIEESEDSDSETIVRVAWSSSGTAGRVRPPEGDGDLSSRFAMVVMGGLAAGVIGAILVSALVSMARGSSSGVAAILAFFGSAIAGMLIMFRMAVPTDLLLWRNKPASTRAKVIEVLTFGSASGDFEQNEGPVQPRQPQTPAGRASQPVEADTAPHQSHDGAASIFDADNGGNGAADPVANIDELIAVATASLTAFADRALQSTSGGFPAMPKQDQRNFQVYLAGAAQSLAEHDALTPLTAQEVLAAALDHVGMDADASLAFANKLSTYAYQGDLAPLLTAGRNAMAAQLKGAPAPESPALPEVMAGWTKKSAVPSATTKFMVLLASTLDSAQVSNPQRAWRTHDSMVRIALKINQGTEIRSDDDGLLASFSDATAAVAAATEIQQSAAAFARENPSVNFSVKVAVHAGDVAVSDQAMTGEPMNAIARMRAQAKGGEILCGEWIRAKTAGTIYRYAAAGTGAAENQTTAAASRLLWEPKRVYAKGALEYRSIGAKPKPGADE